MPITTTTTAALLAGIGSVMGQVFADATSEFSRAKLSRKARRRALREATNAVMGVDTSRFVQMLSPEQIHIVSTFVHSPQFTHLVLQAAIARISGTSDDESLVRDQIRQSLRITGVFTADDLYEVTNLIDIMLHSAASSLNVTSEMARGRALAIASEMAAAGVRNGELLRGIASLDAVHTFIFRIRQSIASQHESMRISHAGRTLTATHRQMYVAPTVRLSSETGWLQDSALLLDDPGNDAEDDLDGDLDDPEPARWSSPATPTPTLNILVGACRRLVILGDPGAGKSTFTNKLVHDIATDQIPDLKGCVPFW